MPRAARVDDTYDCKHTDPMPHPGGVIKKSSLKVNVFVEGKAVARAGDPIEGCPIMPYPNPLSPGNGPPSPVPAGPIFIATGSASIIVNGAPAARMGDLTSHATEDFMSAITTGAAKVYLGGPTVKKTMFDAMEDLRKRALAGDEKAAEILAVLKGLLADGKLDYDDIDEDGFHYPDGSIAVNKGSDGNREATELTLMHEGTHEQQRLSGKKLSTQEKEVGAYTNEANLYKELRESGHSNPRLDDMPDPSGNVDEAKIKDWVNKHHGGPSELADPPDPPHL